MKEASQFETFVGLCVLNKDMRKSRMLTCLGPPSGDVLQLYALLRTQVPLLSRRFFGMCDGGNVSCVLFDGLVRHRVDGGKEEFSGLEKELDG